MQSIPTTSKQVEFCRLAEFGLDGRRRKNDEMRRISDGYSPLTENNIKYEDRNFLDDLLKSAQKTFSEHGREDNLTDELQKFFDELKAGIQDQFDKDDQAYTGRENQY